MEIEEGGGKAGASGGGSGGVSASHGRSNGGGGVDIELGWPQRGGEAYLVWRDLTVMLPNFGQGPVKKLLKGLNGYAEPGRIMAIMGPSGSGKSTLLDSLAGIRFLLFSFLYTSELTTLVTYCLFILSFYLWGCWHISHWIQLL